MKTQHQDIPQYYMDILNILSQRKFGGLMNTKDRHDIDFISLFVLTLNVRCLDTCAHSNRSLISIVRISICKPSQVTIPQIMNYWLCSSFNILNIFLSWRRYSMTHDVIDSVVKLIFLLYAWFHHNRLYQSLVQTKWSTHSCTGRETAFEPTAATSSKIIRIFF